MADFQTPKSVTDYFDQKGLKPSFSWQDVTGDEHAHSFTVAKATETELLSEFQSSLSQAIKDGETFETWKEGLEPRFRKLGWWGPRTVSDPTGVEDPREVNFASPRRLRTIFQSNMRSARAAGQWQRIERTKKALPFILYIRTSSSEPRIEHLAFEGTILPVDHPFWRTHFPPNGWGCKCSVRQITAREASRLGYNPDDEGPKIIFRKFVNRRTGEVTDIPEGIDPGWHTNAGLSRARTLTKIFADNLKVAPVPIAAKKIREFWNSDEREILRKMKARGVNLPVAVSPVLADELGTDGSFISIYADEARGKLSKEKESRQRSFDKLPDILMNGMVIDEQQSDRRTLLLREEQRWFKAVVGNRNGFLRVVTFYEIWETRAQRMIETYGTREQ